MIIIEGIDTPTVIEQPKKDPAAVATSRIVTILKGIIGA